MRNEETYPAFLDDASLQIWSAVEYSGNGRKVLEHVLKEYERDYRPKENDE